MKTSFGLVFSALFVSAVFCAQIAPNTVPIQLLPGQSYIYAYSGRIVSGIAQLDTNAAVLEIQSDIVLQPENDGTKVAMQMTNIRVGSHNGIVPNHFGGKVVIDHQERKEYDQELSKPIRFLWIAGQVKSFEAQADEPEWSINMKKSILSLLNLNLNPQKIIQTAEQRTKHNQIHVRAADEPLVVYPIYEDGVGGICETLYEVKQSPYVWQSQNNGQQGNQQDQQQNILVLNVTKTRVYDNCLTQPTIEKTNVDIRGAPVACQDGKPYPVVAGYYPLGAEAEYAQIGSEQIQQNRFDAHKFGACAGQKVQDSPVGQFNYVRYNISKAAQEPFGKIESIFGEGKTILTTNGKQILVVVQQNITLDQVLPTTEVGPIKPVINGYVHQELSFRLPKPTDATPLDMPYFHLFGKVNAREYEQLIPELLNSLAEDIIANDVATNKNTMQKTVELSNAISVLDIDTLEQIFVKIAVKGRSQRATAQEQIVRKLLIDLIGGAGSTHTALLAVRLYEKDLLTTLEAKELFEAIPQNLFLVDLKVVETYLNLFLSDKVQEQRHLAASLGIALGKLIHEAENKRRGQTPGDLNTEEDVFQQRRAQAYVNANANNNMNNMNIHANMEQNININNMDQQQQQSRRMAPEMNARAQFRRFRRSAPWEQQFPQEQLQKDQIAKVFEILAQALRQSQTFHQKVTLIETLAHMALPEVLQILAPYVSDKAPLEQLPGYLVEEPEQIAQERNFIRQVVIYSLAHVARQYPQQVLALLLPVYENKAEPYEIRIAAFTVMLHSQPGKQILERVASELHHENNRQVRSFVASSLQTAANFTQPGWKQLADDARLAVQLAPKDQLGLHYSKMVGQDYYDADRKYGLNYLAEWVSSNVSQIPRSAYFALSQTKGPFKTTIFELGYNAKGVDSLLKRLMEPNGIVSDAFEQMQTATKDRRVMRKRSTIEASAKQALNALKEKLNLVVRAEDEPKATVFMKMFERTSYLALDRHYLHSIIDSAEDSIKDAAAQLIAGKSFHYVKLIMPAQLYKMVPSELGLPVVITQRHPTILSVKINKAKLQLDMPKQAVLPTGANLTVQMVPTLWHSTYDFVFALTPATQEAIGTHVEKTTRASFPVEFSVGFKRNAALSWSIVPTVPQEIVHHHVSAKTFISKAAIAGSPDRDWLQEAVEIKTRSAPFVFEKQLLKKQLGLGLRVQIQSENAQQGKPDWFNFETVQKRGLIGAIFAQVAKFNDEITPREVHIHLETAAEKPVTGFDFNLRYKKVQDLKQWTAAEQQQQQQEQQEQEYEQWTQEELNQARAVNNRQSWIWAASTLKNAAHSKRSAFDADFQMPVSAAPTSEQVWQHLFGTKYAKQSIRSVARDLMSATKPVWFAHWAQEQGQQYSERSAAAAPMPAIIAHDFVLTAIARSSRPTYYGVNALLVKTFDERAYWLKVNAFARKESIENFAQTKTADNHKELCFDGVISYPAIPDEFYYEPSATQDLKAKVQARLAVGFDCQSPNSNAAANQAQILMSGIIEKTEEKVIRPQDLARTANQGQASQQPEGWFYQQCAVDRAQGKSLSYACERAIIEDSYFKQLVADFEYQNIPAPVKNLTRKALLAAKVALYKHLDVNEALENEEQSAEFAQNKPNQVRLTVQYSTRFADVPLANIYLRTPKQNIAFEKVQSPVFRPLNAILPLVQVYKNQLQQFEATDKCVVMENYVRTFDNVTVRLDQLQQSPCQFLVAKDCAAEERFAVFARQIDADTKTKQVTVLVGGSEIRLLPPTKSNTQAQVIIDGRTVALTADQAKPEIVAKDATSKHSIIVYLRKPRSQVSEPVIVVKAEKADLKVLFDGKNIKVQVGKKYQGKTCGLCGDNNDETENELTGPDACIYQKEKDFIASYALAGQHCEQSPVPEGPKRCPASVETTIPLTGAQYQKAISTQYGYVQLKDQEKKTRMDAIQAQANAEEYARLNQAQMEQVLARSSIKAQQQFAQQQQQYPQIHPQMMVQGPLMNNAQRLRTYFVQQVDKLCFSTAAVLKCVEGLSRPDRLEPVRVDFHCLPASSVSAQRLSERAVNGENLSSLFAHKAVHYTQYVQVPNQCVAL